MRPSTALALLTVLFATTSAWAQIDGLGRSMPAGPRFDEYNLGDGTQTSCANGNYEACFALEFGRCADANPRVAIPACSRQLNAQDNRVFPGNVRYQRAIRYALRANAYAKQGNTDRALSDYDRAVIADRNIFWIHSRRGEAYFFAGDYEEALESFDAAIELSPNSAAVLVNRALVFAASPDEELRNAPQALADAQRANQLAPRQPAYVDALACAYAANGDFDRAVAEQQRAIRLLAGSDEATVDEYRSRLDLYQQGMPFVMTPEDA